MIFFVTALTIAGSFVATTRAAADTTARSQAIAGTFATSNVTGHAFDRIAIFYFENQNFAKAYGDANFKALAKQGIALTNYYGVTHPSQPNYFASIAGDYLGLDNDNHATAPSNISTVIDLLESKGVSWAHYEEDMPYTGFPNDSYISPNNGRNIYVRKHNPAVHFLSITNNLERLGRIKNLSSSDQANSEFHKDLNANRLPQWMFITPNMQNDGHNTDVGFAGRWASWFLKPLLKNPNFNNNRTLILLTWDESEIKATIPNRILAIQLGNAVPSHLVGTEDNNFYNHYTEIASVSANWDLPTLGRWDVGANVYQLVANKTGDKIRTWSSKKAFNAHYYATPYAGAMAEYGNIAPVPRPNLALSPNAAGRSILQSIQNAWANSTAPTYYVDSIEVADGSNPPIGYSYGTDGSDQFISSGLNKTAA